MKVALETSLKKPIHIGLFSASSTCIIPIAIIRIPHCVQKAVNVKIPGEMFSAVMFLYKLYLKKKKILELFTPEWQKN